MMKIITREKREAGDGNLWHRAGGFKEGHGPTKTDVAREKRNKRTIFRKETRLP